jgi:hypothetical protein
MSLGSGIRNKSIPDPGSRIQGSKRPQSRIPDPDPQHWLLRPGTVPTLRTRCLPYGLSLILFDLSMEMSDQKHFFISILIYSNRYRYSKSPLLGCDAVVLKLYPLFLYTFPVLLHMEQFPAFFIAKR